MKHGRFYFKKKSLPGDHSLADFFLKLKYSLFFYRAVSNTALCVRLSKLLYLIFLLSYEGFFVALSLSP